MAGAGKDGQATNKRVETLEAAMSHVHERLDEQSLHIQHQTDSMASIAWKMDEVFKAVLKNNPDESDRGKKVSEEGSSRGTEIPVETTRG